MRINMISPIPFCPSLEPCPKLTPVQVRISKHRIHVGGAFSLSGARYSSLCLMRLFASRSNAAAPQNPTTGETSSDVPTSVALDQSTPSPNRRPPARTELAKPTPIIEPINACELDAGRPKYHVPTFQIMADSKRENTMAKPAADPTFKTSSAGRRETTLNATAPLERSTPIRFQPPDQMTATLGLSVWV